MPKTYLADNLRFLLQKNSVKNADIAKAMGKNAQAVTEYLAGRSKPQFDGLLAMSDFFNISLDDLVYKNLSEQDISVNGEWVNLERQKNLLVPIKAHAGYIAEWGQEQAKKLEQVHIPGVFGEARTWEIEGDSMEPLVFSGDFVSGSKANINHLIGGGIYVVVTMSQGIHIKFVEWHDAGILLTPANAKYQPYTLPLSEIRELWNINTRITRRIIRPTVYRDQKTTGSEPLHPVIRVERGED
jgi:transcriptional regulator with XRE-family HTH domain